MCDLAVKHGINLRKMNENAVTAAFDETTEIEDVDALLKVLNKGQAPGFTAESIAESADSPLKGGLQRRSSFMTQSVFNSYHCEHEMRHIVGGE